MTFTFTEKAALKAKEIIEKSSPGSALRVSIVGGGCSGFSYNMVFDSGEPKKLDKVFEFYGLRVYVDQASALYLDGATIDYLDTLEASGFKFDNPNAKSTCGCGSSFSA